MRLVSFFAERDRTGPSVNEEEQEHEHENTELAEISELLNALTPGIEKLIAQQLKVQELPARASQHRSELCNLA